VWRRGVGGVNSDRADGVEIMLTNRDAFQVELATT
jgi:hypothetical protein